MNTKLTFPELVKLVAEATGTTQRLSELFLKELFATISQALIDGENVSVKNFGTFKLTEQGADKLTFVPDKKLAEAINTPFAAFETVVLSDDITDEMLAEIDRGQETGVSPAKTEEVAADAVEVRLPEEPAEELSEQEPTEEPAFQEPTPPPFVAPVAQPVAAAEIPAQPVPAEQEPQIQTAHEEAQAPTYVGPQANDDEPEVYDDEPEPRPRSSRSFLLGLLTGLAAAAVIAGITWAVMGRGGNEQTAIVPADTLTEQAEPVAAPVVTDTITGTMYITKMAKEHYGHWEYWVYIYDENKDKIADPNNIPIGTVLVVPNLDKYGVDSAHVDDSATLRAARARSYELLRPNQDTHRDAQRGTSSEVRSGSGYGNHHGTPHGNRQHHRRTSRHRHH